MMKKMKKYKTFEEDFLTNFVASFQWFIEEFDTITSDRCFKQLLYAVLKTEGDILVELSYYD